jgi:ParB family chromosome partitioning protein
VYGERRVRAARIAGLTEIPCEITDHTDDELIEIGLAENIQRRDLTPLEEARAFKQLIDKQNYSTRSLAERLGKHRSYIDNRLALLHVPEDVRQMVVQRPDTISSARQIARLKSADDRRPIIEGLVQRQISAADVNRQVNDNLRPPIPPTIEQQFDEDLVTINAIFSRWESLNTSPTYRVPIIRYVRRLLIRVKELSKSLHIS